MVGSGTQAAGEEAERFEELLRQATRLELRVTRSLALAGAVASDELRRLELAVASDEAMGEDAVGDDEAMETGDDSSNSSGNSDSSNSTRSKKTWSNRSSNCNSSSKNGNVRPSCSSSGGFLVALNLTLAGLRLFWGLVGLRPLRELVALSLTLAAGLRLVVLRRARGRLQGLLVSTAAAVHQYSTLVPATITDIYMSRIAWLAFGVAQLPWLGEC